MRILIPTAGNRSVLIEAFRRQPRVEAVITTEIDPLAPGNYFADRSYQVPRSADPLYMDAIADICRKERITTIFPLADLDVIRFASEHQRFLDIGVRVFACPDETIRLSMDKLLTYRLFCRLGLPTPLTLTLGEAAAAESLPYPMYLKPRHAGMKNSPRYIFSRIANSTELKHFAHTLEAESSDYLVQESLLGGKEINVDFFAQDRQLKRLVTLYRLKAGDGGGIIRGQTIPCDPRIRAFTETLVGALDFQGPANFQVFTFPDRRMMLTEINPRFSNSSALVVLPAGVDFFDLSLRLLQGEGIAPEFETYELLQVTSSYQPIIVRNTPRTLPEGLIHDAT